MTTPYQLPRCCRLHHDEALERLETMLANAAADVVTRWVDGGDTLEDATAKAERLYEYHLRRFADAVEIGVGWARTRLAERAT